MKKKSQIHRIIVSRSVKHTVGQVISDSGQTLFTVSDNKLAKMPKAQKAKQVGIALAEKIAKAKISKIVFDRGQRRYHGRIKAVAEGLREKGVKI